MSSASYRLAPLDATHDRTFFNSDSESLNRYSRGKPFKTFVVVSLAEGQRIAGYYTLASASISTERSVQDVASHGDTGMAAAD